MKDIKKSITYKDKVYTVVFNLNVMEVIQEEYGSIDKWGELTDGKSGEVNAKALIFGMAAMINEGLEIESEETGTPFVPVTLKQAGRIITEIGLQTATETLNETVVESSKDDHPQKNG